MKNFKNVKLDIISKNTLDSISKQCEQNIKVESLDGTSPVNMIRSTMNGVISAYSTCYTNLKDNFIECVKELHEQRESVISDVESDLIEVENLINECEQSYRKYQFLTSDGDDDIDVSSMDEKRAKLAEYRKHLNEIKENYYAK